MADFDGTIEPAADWADIPQLGVAAVALGGVGGAMNAQALALAKRIAFLNSHAVPDGPRDALLYVNSTSVRISSKSATMGGFRFRGQYTKDYAPRFPIANQTASCVGAGLGAESVFRTENWYAIFVAADAGDASAVTKTMPFLRVYSRASNVITLNKAGEGIHTAQLQTYAWTAANNLVGCECLVISQGGMIAGAAWSGRVTTITANTAGTVTLADGSGLAFGDWLLPAPPGYDFYCYRGSFYMDTAEVRNLYDSGTIVKSKMINILSGRKVSDNSIVSYAAGGFASGSTSLWMDCGGYISPLATGVVMDADVVLSGAPVGAYAEYFDGDGGGHIQQTCYSNKNGGGTETIVFDNVQVGYLYHQMFNWSNAGLVGSRTAGKLNITGWIEP